MSGESGTMTDRGTADEIVDLTGADDTDAADTTDGTEGAVEWGRPSAPVSSRVAVAATVGFALLVGWAVDGIGWAAVGPLGGLAVGWGIAATTSDRKRHVAAGSVAVVLGSTALAAAAVLSFSGDVGGYVPVIAGSGVVALAAWDGFDDDARPRLKRCVAESGFVSVGAFVAFSLVFLLFATGLAGTVVGEVGAMATATPLAALAWLQVGLLATGLLAHRAAAVVEEWAPGDPRPTEGLAGQFMLRTDDVPSWYLAAVIGQFVVATLLPGLVEPYVAARPLLARTVDLFLLSGVAQVAVAALLVVLGCVAVAPFVRQSVVFWTGTSPGYTLAFAAGGVAAIACSLAVGVGASLGVAGEWLVPSVASGSAFAAFGPAVPILAGMFGAFVATATLAFWVHLFVVWAVPTGEAFAVGAASLLVGTLLLANALPTVVVVLGAAVALFAWDVGVHATTLSRDLDGVVPPARTEVVHAVAAGGALLAGVVLATLVGYLAVPLPVPAGRATVALALALVALVAIAFALRR